MPHSTSNMSQTQTITNGEVPKSQFLDHLTSYPVVSDSIDTYKSNSYGRKSIDLANDAYGRFGKPIAPHLQGPYSIVKPYVEKADNIANDGLSYVDQRFPIVKEDSEKVKQTALDYILWPYHLVLQGRDYLIGSYNDEYQKVGNGDQDQGLFRSGKAVISTELRVAGDVIQYIQSYLGPKREEAEAWASAKRQQFRGQVDKTYGYAQDKAGQLNNLVQEKTGQAQQQADAVAKDANAKKEDAKAQTKATAEQTKKKANEKTNG